METANPIPHRIVFYNFVHQSTQDDVFSIFINMLNEEEALVVERTRVKALLVACKEAFKTLVDVILKST
jgi:S-adenosylmethionine:tRNA-ribosyltransferase-isomerase (queuine synthetase)